MNAYLMYSMVLSGLGKLILSYHSTFIVNCDDSGLVKFLNIFIFTNQTQCILSLFITYGVHVES